MKTLYLDLTCGIAGDMFVAALIGLGVDGVLLESELKKLKLDGYHIHISHRQKALVACVKFDVHVSPGHTHDAGHHGHRHPRRARGRQRNFTEIKQLITDSALSAWVKQKSIAVYRRIAEAEARVHGHPPEEVHFHEVGAVDSIVDIISATIALELLDKPRLTTSPVIDGTGWTRCSHGRIPIPAPATKAILGARGIGITQCEEPQELVTPTGAALLAEFAESFGPMENLKSRKTGFGLGGRENRTRSNLLRAVMGHR